MKVEVNKILSESLRQSIRNEIKKRQPRFCCEIDAITFQDALALVRYAVEKPASLLLVIQSSNEGKEIIQIVDLDGFRSEVEDLLNGEGTLSVTDIEKEGGYLFDLTENEGDNESFSFLVAAWGKYEDNLKKFDQLRSDCHFFRGN